MTTEQRLLRTAKYALKHLEFVNQMVEEMNWPPTAYAFGTANELKEAIEDHERLTK